MAKESLRVREIIGHTQTNRQGLGSTKMELWSKTKVKAKRDMAIPEIRNEEDQGRFKKQYSKASRDSGQPRKKPSSKA